MLFKEVTQGTPIYALDRQNANLKRGSVVSVSQPHFDANMVIGGQVARMVVDVTMDFDGVKKTYVILDNAETNVAEGLLFTPNKETIIRELQGLQGQAESALRMIDHNKEIIGKCQGLISELDPVVKERQETELRLQSLEATNKELLSQIGELVNAIKSIGVRG